MTEGYFIQLVLHDPLMRIFLWLGCCYFVVEIIDCVIWWRKP